MNYLNPDLFHAMHPLLHINNLTINFVTENETVQALQDISFSVNSGEIVAVVGESGSGKSVTALSVLQLLPAPPAQYISGQILFSHDGNNQTDTLCLNQKELRNFRGNRIAMIFQEPMTSLNPVFSCGQQVTEAILSHQRISIPQAREKTFRLFEKVKLPDPEKIFKRYPHQLSGGQKQRVMIAMAMSCSPSLLIADEPTTALDVTVQKRILQLIKDLQRAENLSVMLITHDLGIVSGIADRAVVMNKGKIVEQGQVEKLFTSPEHPYTKALLACRPILHSKGERLPVVSDFLESEKYEVRSTKYGSDNHPNTDVAEASNEKQKIKNNKPTSLLSVEELAVWFPSAKTFLGRTTEYVKAVDGVSFDVFEGETLGLVGESGCGKTTLSRALLRLIEPTSGKITYRGKDFLTYTSGELRNSRKEIQIIFQDPYSSLNPRLTIGNAISEPLKVHGTYLSEKQRKEKVIDLLEKVNLEPDHYSRYPHEFSGGQRQRISIARALALNPGFIVCDESVSALDVSVQAQVLNLLNDLKKEFGFTSIFISHDLAVVHYVSDRIMVMNKGQIEEIGDADQVFYHPAKVYTQRLIESIPAP